MSTMVCFEGVSFSYCTEGNKNQVFSGLDLSIPAGEFTCILGNSGCGKSTLLRLAAGFEVQDLGTILIDGKAVTSPGMDRAMVFQEFDQLLPWKTVYENIAFPLHKRFPAMGKGAMKEYIMDSLAMTSMEGYSGLYPHELSGGMKQRVALSRALAVKPKVLLMDEPFASLDPKGRAAQQQLVLKLWKETGLTVLFVTHDVTEAVLLSDVVYLMEGERAGKLSRYENLLPRPRDREQEGFREFCETVHTAYS